MLSGLVAGGFCAARPAEGERIPHGANPEDPASESLPATSGASLSASQAKGDKTASELARPAELRCEGQAEPLAVAAAHPQLSWRLGTAQSGLHGMRMRAYQMEAAATEDALNGGKPLLWESGKREAEANALPAATYAGPALEPGQRVWWRVRVWDGAGRASLWSRAASFTAAPAWHAQWIAAYATDAEAGRRPMPLFRKQFQLDAAVRRAVLHIAGLGQYEAHINGIKVGGQELTPGWSDYRKTVFYDSYDVTRMVHVGANALGVMLGNGMFRVQRTAGRYTKLEGSLGPPELIAELTVELANGKTVEVASDGTWKTAEGPIVFSSPYGGEDYDARRERAGWDGAGLDDGAWRGATVIPGPGGVLRPELAAPIAVQKQYSPRTQRALRPGVTVYDLGQNMAGWPALAVRGPAGSTVRLIGGELLNPDGSVSQKSTGKPQWFSYTLQGAGVERWHPRFSYWGFRYVQVETEGGAEVVRLEGQAVHSSSAVAGGFDSSNDLLNRIHALILRAIENNAQSVLTDCPHREKLGWLEQTHLLAPSLLFDFDFDGIYRALAQNLADGQKASGVIPEIVPQYVVFDDKWGPFNDSPEWGSAAVLAPWYLFERNGNVAELLAQRAVMERYVDYLGTRAENGIVSYGLGDWYDIGPGEPGLSKLTTAGVTATAIYYQDLMVLARVEALAGNAAASRHTAELAATVRTTFNQRFFDAAHHRYDKGSQTAQAMPLVLGMEPEGERAAVLQALVDDIHAHGDHVTAGDIGYHYVVDALLENGRSDVLLQMLERTDAPSYGYQLAQGATALTEAWDAHPASSQDHFMLGDVEEWLYSGLGGIRIDMAARNPQQLRIVPAVVGDVSWVQTHYDSAWGRVISNWRKTTGAVTYAITIPVNATATLHIGTTEPALVTVNGARAATAAGVLHAATLSNAVEMAVGSGSYTVVAPLAQTKLTSTQTTKQVQP